MTEEEEIREIRPLCKLCFEAFGEIFWGGVCPWRLGDGRRIICREKGVNNDGRIWEMA